MLITPHFLIGAALTKKTNSLLRGLPLAFASHFVLDFIPNWDVGLTSIRNISIVAIDGLIAFLLIGALSASFKGAPRVMVLLWIGGFFGILPDILSQGSKIIGVYEYIPLESFHQSIQRNAQMYWSLPVQILVSYLLFKWIRHKKSSV